MARTLNRLTANQIKAAKGKQMLADGGGLYLQVTTAAARSWLFRYRWQGGRPEIGLGSYPAVTLAEARRRAEMARAVLAELPPRDPRHALKGGEENEVPTFGAYASEWLDSNLDDFRNAKHRQQWRNTLQAYAKPLWEQPVDKVETAHVLEALQPIWNEKRETARRVRGRIERVLDAAKATGLRTGENPARWRGHLKSLLPDQKKPVKHHAALPFADVPSFIARLRKRDALSARALEFLILTCTRSSEGRGALWTEIDMVARLWILPPERMKESKEHRVPLSDAAMAILEPLSEMRTGDNVFPNMSGKGHISETAVRNLMSRMGMETWTMHGFRSAFRDWAGEKTAFPRDVAEMAIAHVVGDQTERAYRRGDALEKRRELVQAWADYCGGKSAGKVVRLHG
jgi:integrase